VPNDGHARHENTFLSESETTRSEIEKVISDGEAGKRDARSHKVTFTLNSLKGLRGSQFYWQTN